MTQHTPGPWKAQTPRGNKFSDIEVSTEAWDTPVASVFNIAKPTDDPEDVETVLEQAEANARLIAAAPEMHEELIQLRRDKAELAWALRRADTILAAPFGTYNGADFESAHIQAVAAIAKATPQPQETP